MPVFVDKVFPGSSAERARVSVGDRILKVKVQYLSKAMCVSVACDCTWMD
jgi:C-terminal processing protease CtpA/Prc